MWNCLIAVLHSEFRVLRLGMLPEAAAFLDRVCADPDDDGPRLILADWLDEHGDPRGEFIRVQLALARLPADDPHREALVEREAALLARFHVPWTEGFKGLAAGPEFRRGFVETINIDGRTFLRRADELFRMAPIRHVRLLDVGSTFERLIQSPQLARLTALTVYAQHMDDRLTRLLAESPYLEGLRSLNIGRNRVGDRGVERLAWSPRFRQLVDLNLSDNAIGDGGARVLAESSNLAGLMSLELRRNELTRAGLGYLVASNVLASLRHLGLAQNHIRAPREWTSPAAGVVGLNSLDLTENGLTEDAVGMMTLFPGLESLARLDLSQNEVGSGGAAVLARWAGACSIQCLRLENNRVGDDGARSLARSPYLHRLADLDLSDNPIHDPGAFAFLNVARLPRLRRLRLPTLGISPQVRRAIAQRYPG
jgi:uncharacterized protein (TIGR02996 family)